MNRAVFLDRDGVINEKARPHEYITSWELFKFLPSVKQSFAKLAKSEYKIIILTNQRGLARGILDMPTLELIHRNLREEIEVAGGRMDRIYHCPHDLNSCNCRKPLPGMLDQAKEDFNLDLSRSWIIGDSESDVQCGKARSCRTIYIGDNETHADFKVKTLKEAIDVVLSYKEVK